MKSKITCLKPEEVGSMKFKEVKMIVKKDLVNLVGLGKEGANFFLSTDFKYVDSKAGVSTPLLIISEFKGAWKKHVKDSVKPPHKTSVSGNCSLSVDGKTLTLNIEKGKAKHNAIKNALKKSKILPSVSEYIFNDTPKLDAYEAIDAMDDSEKGDNRLYNKILKEAKQYKDIELDNGKKRCKQIKKIDTLIASWQKKNAPIEKGDTEKEKCNAQLNKLRGQLHSHRLDIQVNSREGAEPITEIQDTWKKYIGRPTVQGMDALMDLEDRADSIADLQEEIQGWLSRNPAPLCEAETKLKKEIDRIQTAIDLEVVRLSQVIPAARIEHVKLMLEKITKATPEEKKALKEDVVFLGELARTIPVGQINNVRKLLGLPPVKEEDEVGAGPSQEAREDWKDPEIQKMFKDFAKFTTFEVAVDHRADPAFIKKVRIPANTQVWKEAEGIGSLFSLGADFDCELISDDGNGNLRLKAGDKFYFAPESSVTGETHYEVLDGVTPLFPTPPSKNHIAQGGLGDCYLLAAISSLADKDSSAIEAMMMDKGETVTVRLFDVVVDPVTKDKKFTARYFNINKSIVKAPDNSDAYTHDHLWVQMLEKAYAAGSFTGDYNTYNKNAVGTYKKIADGYIYFAMEVLTGKAAESLNFAFNSGDNKDYAPMGIPTSERGKSANEKIDYKTLPWGTAEMSTLGVPQYNQSMVYRLLNNSVSLTVKWKLFVQRGSIDQLFTREHSGGYDGQVTLDDFEQLFKGKMKDAKDDDVTGLPVLDGTVATAIIDWLKSEKIYPGKRGSGTYSKLQLNLFKDVKEALGADKLVGLASKEKVGRVTDGSGNSGGEAISGGLVGSHAYSVLTSREDDPLKELEIRNPWAKTVQKNLTVAKKITEVETALKKLVKDEYMEGEKLTLLEMKAKLTNDIKKLRAADKGELVKKQQEVLLRKPYETAKLAFDKLIEDYRKLNTATSFEVFKTKVTSTNKFEAGVKGLKVLEKKDPTALISKALDKSEEVGQEEGEFWLLLDDLTRRFSSIHIG